MNQPGQELHLEVGRAERRGHPQGSREQLIDIRHGIQANTDGSLRVLAELPRYPRRL
jgi:hypothetical protein